MLAFKASHNLAPQHLTDLLMPYTPRRNLSSSQSGLLVVLTRLRSRSDRACSSYAPKLWNSLTTDIRKQIHSWIFNLCCYFCL